MDFDFEKNGITSKLTRKQKIIIFSSLAAVLIVLFIVINRGCASSKISKERKNSLELVNLYIEKNEYDRALDKLDDLLIKNKNDKEALELLYKILAIRNGNDGTTVNATVNPNVTVEVDTEGLSEVMKSSIDSMRKDLAKNNDEMRSEIAKNNESIKNEMARNNKATENLLRQQQEQHAKQLELQKAEEERRKAEAEAKARELKAQEENRKAEEARRKAEEEALAKKNAQLKKEKDDLL